MAFSYKRSLTIDHTLCGAADSTDFPLLVRISDATFKTVANGGHIQNANGFDIAFNGDTGGGSPLFWEIESYDPVNGILLAWVKVPALSHTLDTVIYVFYGDASISTFQSTATSVWDASYVGVYHLGNGVTLSAADSTVSGNNGTLINGPTATAGEDDGGATLVAASAQYIDLGAGASLDVSSLTASMWVKATSFPNAYNTLYSKIYSGITFHQFHVKSTGKLALYINTPGGMVSYDGTGTFTLSAGNWYHLVITYSNGAGLAGYVNGAVDHTAVSMGPITTGNNGHATIGNDLNNSPRYWNGLVDEVRVSNTVRGAEWIAAGYNNQLAPNSFSALGSETAVAGGPSVVCRRTGSSLGTRSGSRQLID